MRLGNLQVWRDHDRDALQLGEFMRLDSFEPAVEAGLLARNVFHSGGRLVIVRQIVDADTLDPVDAVQFFAFLRELTSYGIAVDWRLRTSHGDTRWGDLWHLFPPSEVMTSAGPADRDCEFWREQFFYGLCVMRRGPRVIEVRDRRSGMIRSLRFTSPLHLEAIERLEKGAPSSSVAPEVLAEFDAAGMVLALGSMRLWLPCRFRRSPLSPLQFW